jgi:hypothetical protein
MVAEAANGAASGATAGTSILPGWGTAIGAVLGGVGGYLSGKAKKKAAKKRMQMMLDALNLYKAGSVDAMGNKLSADNTGKWSFNLGIGGQQAANAANAANILAGTTANKSRSEIARDNFNANQMGTMLAARANQAAAMRAGMRTNSNLGSIATALSRQLNNNTKQNLANALMQAKNDSLYNANVASNLGSAANNASMPIRNIQTDLQNMVNGLNGNVMNQMNAIAGAASNPYLYGQTNADLVKGIGGMTSGFAQNMQEQSNFDALLNAIMQKNNTNSNPYLPLLLQNPNYIRLGVK